MQALAAGIGLGTGAAQMGLGMASMPSGPGIAPMMDMISGQQQQQAAAQQAQMSGQQATYALQSSLLQAQQNNYMVQKQKATQDAQYGAAGVNISGSPLSIMTETQQLGDQRTNMILQQGQEENALLSEQGLNYLRQGSAAAFGGMASGMQANYQFGVQQAQGFDSALGAGVKGLGAAAMAGANWLGGGMSAIPPPGASLQTINPMIGGI